MLAMSPASLAMPYLALTAHPAVGAVLLDTRPAWVWTAQGNRIIWSNAAGVSFFGETSMNALVNRTFGDVHPARRHLARLARHARVNNPLLMRLRFFVENEAISLHCLCKPLEIEGEQVILVMASDLPSEDNVKPLFGRKSETDRWRLAKSVDPAQAVLNNLAAEGEIEGALLDSSGQVKAATKGYGAYKNSAGAPDTVLDLAQDRSFAQTKFEQDEVERTLSVAQFGEEGERHFLVLISDQSDDVDDIDIFLSGTTGVDPFDTDKALADIFEAQPANPINHDDILSEDIDDALERTLRFAGQQATKASDSDSTGSSTDGTGGTDGTGSNIVNLPLPNAIATRRDRPVVDLDPSERFTFDGNSGPYHFVWESDALGRITQISEDLAPAVGPHHAAIKGFSWEEILTAMDMGKDDNGVHLKKAMEQRDAWSEVTLQWPVQDTPLRVPVILTGLPIFGRFHGFQGFKGFGVCHVRQASVSPILRERPFQTDLAHVSRDPENGIKATPNHDTPFDVTSGSDIDGSKSAHDILSNDLLDAAAYAVGAVEEMVRSGKTETSAHSQEDKSSENSVPKGSNLADSLDSEGSIEDGGHVMPKSDDPGQDDEKGKAAPDAELSAIADNSDQTKHESDSALRASRYSLVTSLLSGEDDGIVKHSNSKISAASFSDADDTDFAAPDDEAVSDEDASSRDDALPAHLSAGEQDAFAEIAQALIHSGEQSGPTEVQVTGDPVTGDQVTDGADMSSETGEEVASDPAANSDPQSEDMKSDAALRSAASTAFRDILTMDPAFRHMRGRLSPLGAPDKTPSDKTPSDNASSDKTPSVEPTLASAKSDAVPDAESGAAAKDQNQEQSEQDYSDEPAVAVTSLHVPATHHDDELSATGIDTDTIEANVTDDEERAELAAPKVAITMASDGPRPEDARDALDDADAIDKDGTKPDKLLWDRENKQSAIIDMMNKLPTAILVSAEGKTLYASRSALEQLGYGSAEALDDAGGMSALFAGRPGDWLTKTDGRTTLRHADGKPVSVLASVSSINWGDVPAAMLSFEAAASDVPAVGISEEAEKIAELEAILDTATDGVIVLDGSGQILRMNHSAEALFEVDRHDIAGNSFLTLLAEESHKAASDYLESLKQNGVASILNDGREVIGRVGAGGLIPLFMTIGRVAIPGTQRYCAILRDVAQWKRDEEDLLDAKRRAELANNQKSDFLAKVSHEIRTPLNAIIGFSEVMMEERFGEIGNERYKDYLRDIHTSGSHIMSLINDLLDLSKVEAGKMDLRFETTDLNRLVRESVGMMQPQANQSQIIIRTSLCSHLPALLGDDRSLRQIVLNLLSNAVKYTPAGGQVIISTIQEENDAVNLRIRDTGIGMDDAEMEMALEPFRQISSTRAPTEGTGLGLPLTKALVEANKARFSLSSEKDHGTLVEITFPPSRVLEALPHEEPADPAQVTD